MRMQIQDTDHPPGELHVRNVGGIDEASVDFTPGVTILVGRNATNRTSFLQALMAGLGSERVAIKGDADEATVELTLGDRTYTRHLRRGSGGVIADGDPFLDDPMLADLFAFLLESNETRRAVATTSDLRELIMRPVETENVQAEIDRLLRERKSLQGELEEIQDLKENLPELEERRTRLRERIDEKRGELETKQEEIEAANATVEETRKEQSELDDKLAELRSKRSQLDDTRYDLETERESQKSLKSECRDLESSLEELPETPIGDLNELEADISRLREQKQRLESDVNELQNVIGFNEEMLEDTGSSTFADLADRGDRDTENVTAQLVDDEVSCWTCGSTVDQGDIEATIDSLRELSQQKVSEVNAIEDDIDELQSEKRELEKAQRERERIERRLTDVEAEIGRTEETIEDLHSRRADLTTAVETIEEEVDALENEEYSDILDLHKEANQLEYELGKLETDIERVESNVESIESRIADEKSVKTQIDEVNAEIEALRTKIERIEEGAIEQFNDHMAAVLEMLGYANLDRIWIERVERDVREGRRKVSKTVFELHVVRTTDSGTAYEDTVDHLSESEREVTGLVFALAGYLAHEVYEEVPFMLLDSLEAIDSERIAALVEYLADYTGYLFVALLPEDAAALSDDYERITEI